MKQTSTASQNILNPSFLTLTKLHLSKNFITLILYHLCR